MNLPDIETPDGRRAWAFIAICGAGMVFTLFAAVGVYLVRGDVLLAFWLAMAAHAQVFLVIGALGWVLGRRVKSKLNRDGIEVDDR